MLRVAIVTAAVLSATTAQAQPAQGARAPNPDADRDGKVTLAEFKASQAERQVRMFARMDADRDGRITQAEMDVAGRRAQAAGRGPPAAGAFVMRMDADKDGAVTRSELAASVERRFKAADTNADGWLSRGELLMMRQRMRGTGAE